MSAIDISVIIPTYNVERFIISALNSVRDQNFNGKVEIIVVDDCSTDNTVNVVNSYIVSNSNLDIKVLHQPKNNRQGAARNRGLKEARGEYVFFLDGDDMIDPGTFQKMYEKAKSDAYDFVVCDWAYIYADKEDEIIYVNNDLFMFKDHLINEQCEELLHAQVYFTVNKLYKRDFLINNDIWYGEGYIYEDFEFYVKAAQCANLVGIVPNPLYKVRLNEFSTTKTQKNTTLHIESFIKAVQSTINGFQPRAADSVYHLYKHLIFKTLYYSSTRAPRGYRRKTLRSVLKILNSKHKDYAVPHNITLFNSLLFKRRLVQKGKNNTIIFIYILHRKGYLMRLFSIVKFIKFLTRQFYSLNKIRTYIVNSKSYKKMFTKKKQKKILERFYQRPLDNNLVLFLGFDYRFAGNSKYFFEYLRENYRSLKIYFATSSEEVPDQHKVIPRSLKFYEVLASAKVVFVESWVPLDFRKRENSIWVQLWHGTPFKKLFFDSHESCISMYNRNHKRDKQKDIRRWDYLIADSVAAGEKLASAFAFKKEKILSIGYPRVQWLKDNRYNNRTKKIIKKKLGVGPESKVLLYAPTWRDYNYRKRNLNLKYLLNLTRFQYELDQYMIVYKPHNMSHHQLRDTGILVPEETVDTQELILISDLIISDFSSIIFDAMYIDIPFYLYIPDYEEYIKARGIYEDMERLLKPFFISDEEKLLEKIKSLEADYPYEQYYKAKEIYCNNFKENPNEALLEKLRDYLSVTS